MRENCQGPLLMYTVSQINGQSKKFAGNHGNHKRSVPSIPPHHLSLAFMRIKKIFHPHKIQGQMCYGCDSTFMIHGFQHSLLCALICYTRSWRNNYIHSSTFFHSYKIFSKLKSMIEPRKVVFKQAMC